MQQKQEYSSLMTKSIENHFLKTVPLSCEHQTLFSAFCKQSNSVWFGNHVCYLGD